MAFNLDPQVNEATSIVRRSAALLDAEKTPVGAPLLKTASDIPLILGDRADTANYWSRTQGQMAALGELDGAATVPPIEHGKSANTSYAAGILSTPPRSPSTPRGPGSSGHTFG